MGKSAIVAKSAEPPLASIVIAASRAIFVFRLSIRIEPDSTRTLTSRASSLMDENHAVNPTRIALHRIATHVAARARFAATGKFGLRATPGGFGTPAFGADVEVIRVAGTQLVRERGGGAAAVPIESTS